MTVYQCTSIGFIEAVTNPQGKKIIMKKPKYVKCCSSGKTGPLKCNKGFTVRARPTETLRFFSDVPGADGVMRPPWQGKVFALVADQIPVEECRNKLFSVHA